MCQWTEILIACSLMLAQQPNEKKAIEGLNELKVLDKRWEDRTKEYLAAVQKEASPEKRIEIARILSPYSDAKEVAALFELEGRFRGKDTGLFALNFLFRRAQSVGDPDLPVSKGREQALELARAHYLGYAELDLLFDGHV